MIIISKYTIGYKKERECLILKNQENEAVCPECQAVLVYYDSRLRGCKQYGGKKIQIMIRRLKCVCGRIHNELPDFLLPYKHYAADVIEEVLDGISTPSDLHSEDYPCEKTMARWKDFLARNAQRIEGILRNVGHQILGYSNRILETRVSFLDAIRKLGTGWLSILFGPIYNSGNRLEQ